MPEHGPFLAKIIANPADDGPREVYADWLMEQGNAANWARGELICVQVERAKLPERDVERSDNSPVPSGCGLLTTFKLVCGGPHCRLLQGEAYHLNGCRWAQLRDRERELFDDPARTLAWFGLPQPWARIARLSRFDHEPADYPYAIVRRGFVDEVALSWADWGGGACRECDNVFAARSYRQDGPCPACAGTGRVAGHADAIIAATPLRKVRLTTWPQQPECNVYDDEGLPLPPGGPCEREYLKRRWPGVEFELPLRAWDDGGATVRTDIGGATSSGDQGGASARR